MSKELNFNEIETKFKSWNMKVPNQKGNLFDEYKTDQMIYNLKELLPNKLNELLETNEYYNFFKINNITKLREIKEMFSKKSNSNLYKWDYEENGHSFGSSALNRYIKFLKSLEKKNSFKNINNKNNFNIKNIILYGVPGVGKTYNINNLIALIDSGKSFKKIFKALQTNKISVINVNNFKDRTKFLTFHQNFGYEDFIEGFRPNKDGKIELVDGVFKSICKEAKTNKNQNYYIVIDEINRANISKVFGELITLIEEDKRDNLEVILPYSKEPFSVPSNLYIIGTMNSTDKSIALLDVALRRRFTFIKMEPNENLVIEEFRKKFIKLNKFIANTLGEDYKIGHSYFMNIDSSDLDFVIDYKIIPLLEEYFYGDEEGLQKAIKKLEN